MFSLFLYPLFYFDTPLEKINVHVRGGFFIPMQIPTPNLVLSRANPFVLLVALSQSGYVNGSHSFWMLDILWVSYKYSSFKFKNPTLTLFRYDRK